MSSLSDILEEPEDGTTVIAIGPMICGTLVITRDDARAQRLGFGGLDRWFDFVIRQDVEPLSWREFTHFATRAYALGPLLADLEAEK